MKIVIAGYYGFGNAGDELILASILSQFRRRYGAADVSVLSASPDRTMIDHRVKAISRWNPFLILWELWQSDIFVLGGGGLLQNATSRRSLFYYLMLVLGARMCLCHVVLYALGVESIRFPFSKRFTRWVLRHPRVRISVRDRESKQILQHIGLPESSISVTIDPVFCHEIIKIPSERYRRSQKSVLLIPRYPCPASGSIIFKNIARILKEEHGFQVKATLFHPVMEDPLAKKKAGIGIVPEEDFLEEESAEAMGYLVGRFDFVVSARFHGLVLAALAGVPFLGIGDRHKTGRLCEEWKMPYLPWDCDLKEVQQALVRLCRSPQPDPHYLSDCQKRALETLNLLKVHSSPS